MNEDIILAGAREWLSLQFGGEQVTLPDHSIRKGIDQLYPGGWAEFSKGWGNSPIKEHVFGQERSPVDYMAERREYEPTQYQLLRRVMDHTGQAIRLHLMDKVLKVEIQADRIEVLVRCYEVTEGAFRWRVHNEGLRNLTWEKHNDFWIRKHDLTVWMTDTFQPYWIVLSTGKVVTDEVWEDKVEQWHLCYRPGTSRTPLDGPGHPSREGWGEAFDKYERKVWDASSS